MWIVMNDCLGLEQDAIPFYVHVCCALRKANKMLHSFTAAHCNSPPGERRWRHQRNQAGSHC